MAKRELFQNLNPEEMDLVEDFEESSKKINVTIMIPVLGEVTFTEEVTVTPKGKQNFKGNIKVKKVIAKEPKGTEVFTFDEIIDGERIYNQTIIIIPDGHVQILINFLALRFEPKIMPNWLLISTYYAHKAGKKEIRLLNLIHSTKPPTMQVTELFKCTIAYFGRNFMRPFANVFAAKGMVVHFLKIVGTVVSKMTKVGENVGTPKMYTNEDEGKKFLDWIEIKI